MKHLTWLLIILVLFIAPVGFSQSFIPFPILKAVEQGTRTLTGIPGESYFQNSTNYGIDVKFNPQTGELFGIADIVYFNNSPDSLRFLILRLYQNLFKKEVARDETVSPSVISDGMNISSLVVNGEELMKNLRNRTRTEGTLMTVYLKKALKSNDSCSLHVEWNFTMPGEHVHRYGKYAEGTYFVAFWYPQIAVYDDIDGWDMTPHTGTHEFYNDFNNYEVSIRLPAGFMVWATGEWQNPEQIFKTNILQRYRQALNSDKLVQIIEPIDIASRNIFLKKGSAVFRFNASNVPDFAFGISEDYLWDGISALTDSIDSTRVFINTAYREGSKNFNRVTEAGASVLAGMCNNSYGTPYPFNRVTVFNGMGGMEYPMIVNNGEISAWDGTLFVTMHEIAHAWFPFLTGINETSYAWIDEGLTSFLPMETAESMGSEYHTLAQTIRQYEIQSGTATDVPYVLSSWQTRDNVYRYASYIRSVAAFSMLERCMGRDTFRMGIRNFIEVWKFRHPTPYDLFNQLKMQSGKDLDWFIDQWFYQAGWPDLSLGDVRLSGNTLKVEIKKTGAFAVPVIVELEFADGGRESMEWNPVVWKSKDTFIVTVIIMDELKAVRLGNATIPDRNREDNYFEITE